MYKVSAGAIAVAMLAMASTSHATPINSAAPTLSGPPITFEGFAEGTRISNQYPGVTFGQTDGGLPMIDNSPFLFAYHQSSGEAVLTGSTDGGAPFPTVAELKIACDVACKAIEFFLSDDSVLGDYTVSAFGAGNVLLESFTIPLGDPLNRYVGFTRHPADLHYVTVDSNVVNDAFAIDDVRIAAPEPATLALFGLGLLGLGALRRRRAA